MKNAYFYFLLVVVALGLGLTYFLSSQHYDLPVIERMDVETPEEIGQELFTQLTEKGPLPELLFLGVTPNAIEDMELWRGFLEKAKADEVSRIDILVVEQNLPYVELFESQMRLDVKEEKLRLSDGVRASLAEGLRVAIIAPGIYVSQMLPNNPIDLLQKDFGIKEPVSLAVVKYPSSESEAEKFEPLCSVNAGDSRGTGPLGCAIRKLAPSLWRPISKPAQYTGKVEKTGERDYLILLNRN